MVAIVVLGRCNGCGRCAEVCLFSVFEIIDGYAEPVRCDDCIECCACVGECPERAIVINSCQ